MCILTPNPTKYPNAPAQRPPPLPMSKLWCVPGYRDGAGSSPKCVVQPDVVGKTTTPCLAVRGTAWASSPTGMGKHPMGSHCLLEAVRLSWIRGQNFLKEQRELDA